jgi:hypothetical protein
MAGDGPKTLTCARRGARVTYDDMKEPWPGGWLSEGGYERALRYWCSQECYYLAKKEA